MPIGTAYVEKKDELAIIRNNGVYEVDGVPLPEIAERVGRTPFYAYSAEILKDRLRTWKRAVENIKGNLCFSIKSNNNLYLNKIIAREGIGAVAVSGWELEIAKLAGYDLSKSLLHGNGKLKAEIEKALSFGTILSVDSLFDAKQIRETAEECQLPARVMLRINPQIDPHVHPYVATSLSESKFGFTSQKLEEVVSVFRDSNYVQVLGLHSHLGSLITSVAPVLDALKYLLNVARNLQAKGVDIRIIDLGGGLGINYYHDDTILPTPEDYVRILSEKVEGTPYILMFEPGRAIVAECGILVGRVIGVKENGGRNFIVTDASMTELIRPPLYDAYHHIELAEAKGNNDSSFDVVGPVCESSDFLGKNRRLPTPNLGDLVIVFDAGAYGYSMSSNYNLRPSPPEAIIDEGKVILARRRTRFEDILSTFAEEEI